MGWILNIPNRKGYGLLVDWEIRDFACSGEHKMIDPFLCVQEGRPSGGLSVAGFDFRLSPNYKRKINYGGRDMLMDPISPDISDKWVDCVSTDGIIILRPQESILAASIEKIDMPDNVVATVVGKSTYARNNVETNITPLEPGWRGIITIEIHNNDRDSSVKLYVNKGIAQGRFELIPIPNRTYSTREAGGAYQDQTGVTVSK